MIVMNLNLKMLKNWSFSLVLLRGKRPRKRPSLNLKKMVVFLVVFQDQKRPSKRPSKNNKKKLNIFPKSKNYLVFRLLFSIFQIFYKFFHFFQLILFNYLFADIHFHYKLQYKKAINYLNQIIIK